MISNVTLITKRRVYVRFLTSVSMNFEKGGGCGGVSEGSAEDDEAGTVDTCTVTDDSPSSSPWDVDSW